MSTENTTAPLTATAEEQPRRRHNPTLVACERLKGTIWTTDPKYAWPR